MAVIVPVLIGAILFGAAVFGALRLLPPLADDRVGTTVFKLTGALIGAAAAVLGLEAYETIREIALAPSTQDTTQTAGILAAGIFTALRDGGVLVGLAAIVYLLAPEREHSTSARVTHGP